MEHITLEVRPRLQSCNIFVAMRKDLNSKNVQVKLFESSIALVFKDCCMNFLLPSIRIIPTSLSMLDIRSNWISFRLQTMPLKSEFGSFSTEVITEKSDRNQSVHLTSHSQPIVEEIKKLFKTSECVILCNCCKNIISKPTIFKRVLPFPNLDYLDEWFCCKHSSDVISNNIETHECDYLYQSYFSLLHKNIFENNLYIDDKTLICNKCSLHIGILYSNNLFKIWNCCVDYKPQNDKLSNINATNPLDDFLTIIKESLDDIITDEIILQTSIGKQTHYLLIKSMDNNLDLITEPYHRETKNTDIISLEQKRVAKVLYKYDTNKVVDTLNAKYHDINLSTIEAGLKYLLSSTKRLPHNYRNITDYLFGYIILQENV